MPVHDTWVKILGRVQKCDCCESRAKHGVLYQCLTCTLQICKRCAEKKYTEERDEREISHVLNVNQVSWSPTHTSHISRGSKLASLIHTLDRDGDEPSRPQTPAAPGGSAASAIQVESENNPEVATPTPQPFMSIYDLRGAAVNAASIAAAAAPAPPSLPPANQLLNIPPVSEQQSNEKALDNALRCRPERLRMKQIWRLYKSIYPDNKHQEPPTMFQISPIPETWEINVPKGPTSAKGRIGVYQAYHNQIMENNFSFLGKKTLPPPPLGYKEWAFRTYPKSSKGPVPAYSEPARSVPAHSRLNELNADELGEIGNDKDLQAQMEKAWGNIKKTDLAKLDGKKRTATAREKLQLLWEVFQLRKFWTLSVKANQTVQWFVEERDSLA